MGTNTPVYQLFKPDPLVDLVDVTADISDNMDKVEAALVADDADIVALQNRATALEAFMNSRGLIIKAADESVSSSTIMQDDDDFTIPVLNGKKYHITLSLGIGSGSFTPDIKVGFTFPNGNYLMTGYGVNQGSLTSGSAEILEGIARSGAGVSVTATTPYATSSQDLGLLVKLTYECLADGTLHFQWAQNTSNGTATTVKKNSSMEWQYK